MKILIRNWILYLLSICGCVLFCMNYTAWFSTFLLLLVMILPLFSLILMLPPLFCIRIKLVAPTEIVRGEYGIIYIHVEGKHCPYGLPIRVTVAQKNLASEKDTENRITNTILPYPVKERCLQPPFWYLLKLTGTAAVPLSTEHTAVIRGRLISFCMYDFLGLFLLPLPRVSRKQCTETVVCPIPRKPDKILRTWDQVQSVPVPTQRFSEQYEIRQYRPGDTMRAVHWKLSAKTDDLLVREAMDAADRSVMITLERDPHPDIADSIYDTLAWYLQTLLSHSTIRCVTVVWLTAKGDLRTETVRVPHDAVGLYRRLFSEGIRQNHPGASFYSVYKTADIGFHIDKESYTSDQRKY